MTLSQVAVRFGVAIGAGLLIGIDRERRKAENAPETAGIRTFTLASASGALAEVIGGAPLVGVMVGAYTVLAAISYPRDVRPAPGLTTRAAMLVTILIGAFATQDPTLAAAFAVVVTILLTSRDWIHGVVRNTLTDKELEDLLILAAAALVVFPLLPDQYVGPFGALNPRTIWRVVVFVMAIQAAGYVAQRAMGPRFGLPLSGFASGFVSSTATVAAMGTRARHDPRLLKSATAAAALSNIATLLQLGVILATTSWVTLQQLIVPLGFAIAAATIYGVGFTVFALREPPPSDVDPGRAVNVRVAFALGATIAVVLLLSAALNARLGSAGVVAAAVVAGFADAHAPAASTASLVAAGRLAVASAVVPILGALTTNTFTKCVLAFISGGPAFALRLVPGMALIVAAAWGGTLLR